MSEALRELIVATQTKYKADPREAQVTFRSESSLQEGLRSQVAMRELCRVVDGKLEWQR